METSMGRPPSGYEWIRKHVPFPKELVETIELIRKVAPVARPSFVEVVRTAVTEYIERQMQNSEIRAGVDRLRRQRVKVIGLRERKKGND